jgi:hypothetical protein
MNLPAYRLPTVAARLAQRTCVAANNRNGNNTSSIWWAIA